MVARVMWLLAVVVVCEAFSPSVLRTPPLRQRALGLPARDGGTYRRRRHRAVMLAEPAAVFDAAAAVDAAAATTALAPATFEPQMDAQAMTGFGVIFALSAVTYWVWFNVLVPQKRTEVALSKRNGEIRGYLDGLNEAGTTTPAPMDAAVATTSMPISVDALSTDAAAPSVALAADAPLAAQAPDAPPAISSRGFERWLFTDWLEGNTKKEPAVPFLPDNKFNSGDNPVLAGTGLIMVAVVVASVVEKLTGVTVGR